MQQADVLCQGWCDLPFHLLDGVRDALRFCGELTRFLKASRLVNRHWSAWGTESVPFLNLSGDVPLGTLAGVVATKFKRVRGLGFRKHRGFAEADLCQLTQLRGLTHVDLGFCRITNEGLAHVGLLSSLTSLNLRWNKRFTGEGLAHVARLTGLRNLDLDSCQQITDSALEHVASLTALTCLNLSGYSITAAGFAHVGKLTSLIRLDLSKCGVLTDEGIAHVGKLTSLRHLNCCCGEVTGAGFAAASAGLAGIASLRLSDCSDENLYHVGRLTNLVDLCACGWGITDEGLTHVGRLVNLTQLELSDIDFVTDEGLVHLTGLTALRRLD
eukprot:evm.model.scf_466.1 EVM.evm.TU.scf_466.1   scf_466:3401-5419(-)